MNVILYQKILSIMIDRNYDMRIMWRCTNSVARNCAVAAG